jgi:hypothetical protein
MANWKTGFPQENMGPNRYIEEDAAAGGASGATDPIVVASLRMEASVSVAAGPVIAWDATDLPGPYTASAQPYATNTAGTITVTVSGLFLVVASFIVDLDDVPVAQDTGFFSLIWGDASAGPSETYIAQSYSKRANTSNQAEVTGATVSAAVRMDAGDYIKATAYGGPNSTSRASFGCYILIQKIEN